MRFVEGFKKPLLIISLVFNEQMKITDMLDSYTLSLCTCYLLNPPYNSSETFSLNQDVYSYILPLCIENFYRKVKIIEILNLCSPFFTNSICNLILYLTHIFKRKMTKYCFRIIYNILNEQNMFNFLVWGRGIFHEG